MSIYRNFIFFTRAAPTSVLDKLNFAQKDIFQLNNQSDMAIFQILKLQVGCISKKHS